VANHRYATRGAPHHGSARARALRGHLASERAELEPGDEPSFDALARRVVETTQQIESGDLTLRMRTFTVPLEWQRCGAVKSATAGVPVMADRRLSEFASDPIFEFLQTSAYVAVPLRIHSKVAAVLVADNGPDGAAIGVEDISLVYSMAQQRRTPSSACSIPPTARENSACCASSRRY
jgi:hypothetical protein